MDKLIKGYSPSTAIRFNFVDATISSKTLEERHLCGPTAALVMAETVAGAVLLTADTSLDDERVSLRMIVDGPLKGVLIEVSADGAIRGYPSIKILHDYDSDETIDTAPALGSHGKAQIIRSTAQSVLFRASFHVDPPSVRVALARYYNHSMQTPTAVEIVSKNANGYLETAKAITAERMPDGDSDAFVRIVELFDKHVVRDQLSDASTLSDFKDLFGLPDLEERESRPLRFHCHCTVDKVLESLQVLAVHELEDMVRNKTSQEVYCHMCGKAYEIGPDQLRVVLDQKAP